MTLRMLRYAHPELFLMSQDWFLGQDFIDKPCGSITVPPIVVEHRGQVPGHNGNLVTAAVLANAYVHNPKLPIWRDYLWTSDVDSEGQRVYVGGTANGRGFEIHRHIHITQRFGIPLWK